LLMYSAYQAVSVWPSHRIVKDRSSQLGITRAQTRDSHGRRTGKENLGRALSKFAAN
jgi:hypothetical protein